MDLVINRNTTKETDRTQIQQGFFYSFPLLDDFLDSDGLKKPKIGVFKVDNSTTMSHRLPTIAYLLTGCWTFLAFKALMTGFSQRFWANLIKNKSKGFCNSILYPNFYLFCVFVSK